MARIYLLLDYSFMYIRWISHQVNLLLWTETHLSQAYSLKVEIFKFDFLVESYISLTYDDVDHLPDNL